MHDIAENNFSAITTRPDTCKIQSIILYIKNMTNLCGQAQLFPLFSHHICYLFTIPPPPSNINAVNLFACLHPICSKNPPGPI